MACDRTTLESGAKCFVQLSAAERDAAIVWYLWKAAQACASFTSDFDTLLTDGACLKNEPNEVIHAMEVFIAAQLAIAAGASVEATVSEAATGIKCLKFADAQTIKALKIFLTCTLNDCVS